MSNIEQEVKNIIVEQLGVEEAQVVNTASFQDLGADSLDTVELVMALEEKFDIEIDDEKGDFTSVQSVIDYITENQ